jgi:hypothetical protein
MISQTTLLAAGLLSAMTATPVFAQAAIQEPGNFSFFHPNLDVLNAGAPTPAARLESRRPAAMQAESARESGIPATRMPPMRNQWKIMIPDAARAGDR